MTSTIVSFQEGSRLLPSTAINLSLMESAGGHALRVVIDDINSYGFPAAAQVGLEVFHPMLAGNQATKIIGVVGSFKDSLHRDVLLPELPSASRVEFRIVVKELGKHIFLARSERLKPSSLNDQADEGEPDNNTAGNRGGSFLGIEEEPKLDVPWAIRIKKDGMHLQINPNYITKSQLKMPEYMALVLPSAIRQFAREYIADPGRYNSRAWNSFRDMFMTYCTDFDTFQAFLDDESMTDSDKASVMAAAFFQTGGIASRCKRRTNSNAAN